VMADRFLKSTLCEEIINYFNVNIDHFRKLVVLERQRGREKREKKLGYRY
jgi:hypothetical protein